MPEQFKKNATQELIEMEAEIEKLEKLVAENREKIALFDELRKVVEENRMKIKELTESAPEHFEHHKGTWEKAVEDWRNKMRLFSQT